RRDHWQFVLPFGEFKMRKPRLTFSTGEKRAVQRGKQPAFHLRKIAQLMSLRGPEIECLLREIPCVRLGLREAVCEPIKRFVMLGHDLFKIILWHLCCSWIAREQKSASVVASSR